MEYQNVPAKIQGLKSNKLQIESAITRGIERYSDRRTSSIKVSAGDNTFSCDLDLFKEFCNKQIEKDFEEIQRLEGIDSTLSKVAAGLLK